MITASSHDDQHGESVLYFFTQGKRSFYVKCPLHGTNMRSCSRQMSKGTDDVIIRSLMYWLREGNWTTDWGGCMTLYHHHMIVACLY